MLWDGADSLVIRAAHHLSDQYRQQVRIPPSKAEQRRKADGTYAVEVIDLSREPLADPELVAAEDRIRFSARPYGSLESSSER